MFVGTDPVTGHPRQRTRTVEAKYQTEARAALRTWQKELDDNRDATDSTATVALPGRGMAAPQPGPGPGPPDAARRPAVDAETVIFPEFGDVPIADLTPRHLDEWYRKLATGEGRERTLKPASIRRHHAVLSASLSQDVRWGWLGPRPGRACPATPGRTELQVPHRRRGQALLSRGADRNERWGMLLSLAVLTGARQGELCALRWTDVEGERIRIRRSLYRAGPDRGEKSTKGGRERWVVVAPTGRALLEA